MISQAKRYAIAKAALALAAALPVAAQAYVGPGAGLSLLSALWGLIAAIGVAVFFVVMWPIRRMMRRRKAKQPDAAAPAEQAKPAQAPQDSAVQTRQRADSDASRP